MRVLAVVIAGGLAAADSTGTRPVEKLGNSYSFVRMDRDRGLEVEVWRNRSLDRLETWFKPSRLEYFVKCGEDLYLLGVHDSRAGEWRTKPYPRLVFRGKDWNVVR